MKIRTFCYFSREATRGIFRNRLMSLAAVGTITMALLLFGGFYLLTSNIQFIGKTARGQIELRAFLAQSAPERRVLKERIAAVPGVKEVKFIPKEEGAKILNELLGEEGLFFEAENPLPDSFNIYPAEGADIEKIAVKVQQISGVDEVIYGQNFVKFLDLLVRLVWLVGVALVTLAVLAVLYIVVNTIQLTVFARRKEIEIMKLVGATDSFIRWPFLLEGAYLGIVGALIAVFLLLEGYTLLYGKARGVAVFLPILKISEVSTDLAIVLLVMGTLFGAVGSMLSIKRYLKV